MKTNPYRIMSIMPDDREIDYRPDDGAVFYRFRANGLPTIRVEAFEGMKPFKALYIRNKYIGDDNFYPHNLQVQFTRHKERDNYYLIGIKDDADIVGFKIHTETHEIVVVI